MIDYRTMSARKYRRLPYRIVSYDCVK